MVRPVFTIICLAAAAFALRAQAQQTRIVWSPAEKPLAEQVRRLRELPDETRGRATRQLATDIRRLPATPNKVTLASNLASLATEGDFGRDTLEEVATTLARALEEHPIPAEQGRPSMPYIVLAQLIRYEHVHVSLDSPQLAAAISKMGADDRRREQANFTLADLHGKKWTLRELRGKVVLVNFWATWCPPCRKEMPDLEALYRRFRDQGFVILAISDEEADKVRPFIDERKFTFPVLLDPGGKVNEAFQVEGIPKSFVYDRAGRLAAQSIDMRTREQFLEMLGRAGLRPGADLNSSAPQ